MGLKGVWGGLLGLVLLMGGAFGGEKEELWLISRTL